MKCYLVDGRGIDSLTIGERPSAKLGPDDVRVRVRARSLNYRDLMIAKGQYQYPPGQHPPFIPLSDMSGEVMEVGSAVTDLKPGDRVINAPFRHWPAGTMRSCWARTFIGGSGVDGVLAEEMVYPCDSLVLAPSYLTDEEASTLTIAGLTAWASVVTHGRVRPGEWVLLHGTGGVSIFAAQLAKALGAKVVMTTSNDEKAKIVKRDFGVDATVNYRDSDWSDQIRKISSGVNVVVDVVGGETLARSLSLCTYGARIAVVGVLDKQESTIQVRDLLKHQVQMRGIFMESTEELRAFARAMAALTIKPAVDKVFKFDEAKQAYRYLESQKHIGKVVIR